MCSLVPLLGYLGENHPVKTVLIRACVSVRGHCNSCYLLSGWLAIKVKSLPVIRSLRVEEGLLWAICSLIFGSDSW